MVTILVKEVFGFLVTVVASEFVLCNGQAMKEAEMVLVSVIFYIVRELRGISKWACGHDEMNARADNAFNEPLSVGALIFKVR